MLGAGTILGAGVRPHLQSLDLYSTWILRLKKRATLKPLEIRDIRAFCLEMLALGEGGRLSSDPWVLSTIEALMPAEEPLSAIDQILTAGGDIRSDASETLYRLHNEKEKLGRELHSLLDRVVKDYQMETMLQDKYVTTREGRWVVPVKSGRQHHVPGVIHGSSHTKQTVFIEPEKVVPINNRLRQVEVEIEEEIERLLEQLSHYLSAQVDGFETSRQLMELMDIRLSQAQFAQSIEAQPVTFTEGDITLNELKHPLLVLSGKTVIANSVQLTQQKSLLLLSGPNAGGKTVLLKSIGLAAQMARCGLPICSAAGSQLPFFKTVLAGIGDAQSVGEDLSTFAAHLKILTQASKLQGSEHLVLIDEICGSTDPEEGAALARAFIETFERAQVFGVITSHLSPLKAGWPQESRVLNGSLEYNTQTGRPSYHFIAGIPGDSLAIQTAQRVGVPGAIVTRALDVLSPTTRARLQGLEEIEQLKKDIGVLQEHLKKETSGAQALKKKYETLVQNFENEKQEWLTKTVRTAEKKVDEAIQTAKAEDVFRRHRQLQDVKYDLPEIVKAKPVNLGIMAESAEEFAQKFPPGSKVHVPTLGNDGLVQSTPNNKGEVMVLAGSVRLQVHWRDLKPPGRPSNPTADLVRRAGSVSFYPSDQDRVLDLRGKTSEEALEELEVTLDQAVVHKQDRVKVIHGHGTEALKKSVRGYLSRSIYVKKWKAGGPETGGDGVTWIELNLNA